MFYEKQPHYQQSHYQANHFERAIQRQKRARIQEESLLDVFEEVSELIEEEPELRMARSLSIKGDILLAAGVIGGIIDGNPYITLFAAFGDAGVNLIALHQQDGS